MSARIHYRVITPPAIEPVTIQEAKEYMRFCDAPDDDIIASFITAGREIAEKFLGRALIRQTIMATATDVKAGEEIELPRPLLIAIDGITDTVSDTLLTESDYELEDQSEPAKIAFINNHSRLQITYSAGYCDSADDVPSAIKTAIKIAVHHFYDNRLSDELPKTSRYLLEPFRIVNLR